MSSTIPLILSNKMSEARPRGGPLHNQTFLLKVKTVLLSTLSLNNFTIKPILTLVSIVLIQKV